MRSIKLKFLFFGIITILIALLQRMNFEIYFLKPNFVLAWLSSLIVSSLSLYQIWILAVLAVIISSAGSWQGILAASLLVSFISMSWLACRYLKRDWMGLIFTITSSTILFFILSLFLLILVGQKSSPLIFLNIFSKEIIYNILLSLALALITKKR